MAPEIGRQRYVIAAAVSSGSINLPIGTCEIQPSWISSIVFPVLALIELASEPRRSVSVNPGRTLLIVTHSGNSLERDFAQDPIAPRSVFDSPIFGIGSFTEVEIMFTILPLPAFSISGTTPFVKV